MWALPQLVGAFFYSSTSNAQYVTRAREYHARFLSAYPSMEGKVPLVRMDSHNWQAPFSAVGED